MEYKYIMLEGDYPSNHYGSICAVYGKKAKLAEDYGLGNLIIIQSRIRQPITAADMYAVIIYYNDGMQKNMGAKALIRQDNGDLLLVGSHGKIQFKRIG